MSIKLKTKCFSATLSAAVDHMTKNIGKEYLKNKTLISRAVQFETFNNSLEKSYLTGAKNLLVL